MKNTKYKAHKKKQSITAVQLRTTMQEKEKTAAVCVWWAKLI